MSTGWIFYPPPLPVQRVGKLIPSNPPQDPPYDTSRRAALNRILQSWNYPDIALLPSTVYRRYYNTQFGVPDLPPIGFTPAQAYQKLLFNIYLDVEANNYATFYQWLRDRLRRINPELYPSGDFPPPYVLPSRLNQLLLNYLAYSKTNLEYPLPKVPGKGLSFIFIPGISFTTQGYIGFQPYGFWGGYPTRYLGFQTVNRNIALKPLGVNTFLRFVFNENRYPMENKRRGDAVVITLDIYDPNTIVSGPEVLVTPEAAYLNIYDPNNVQVVTNGLMTPVDQGRVNYIYQIPLTAPLGIYTGDSNAIHFGRSGVSLSQALFKVVA